MAITILPVILSLVLSDVFSAPQTNTVPPDALIQLKRTSCFGPCPIYTVSIDARGGVTYEGEKFVRVVGRQTTRIDPSTVAKLLARAESIHFFDLRNAYRYIENPDGSTSMVTDLPTTFVTITANGRTKTVEDYIGAPDALREFEREIDDAAGTKRWIFVDGPALEELTRSGWSVSSREAVALLQQAIEKDDVPIARDLIELGVDVNALRNPSPLFFARSKAMVEVLVKAGAHPNDQPVGAVVDRTPLITTAYKDVGVAEALVKAGARLEDAYNGRTALWYAACAGNSRVVTVLLAAGANPRGSSSMSAVECARDARQREANDRRPRTELDRGRPTLQDFDRVIVLLENAEKGIKR